MLNKYNSGYNNTTFFAKILKFSIKNIYKSSKKIKIIIEINWEA